MRERIMGAETEYAFLYQDEEENLMFVDPFRLNKVSGGTTCHDFLPEDIKEFYFSNGSNFLPNGARFYGDTGGHPEYATQEARSLKDLLLYERIGDVIMEEVVAGMTKKTIHPDARFRVFKNNLALNLERFGSGDLITFGAHENYLLERLSHMNPAGDLMKEILAPFLITRPIFAGNGALFAKDNRLAYVLSQRLLLTFEVTNTSTTASRAIINLRDESHADASKYRRLHLIVGDALMAEVARFMKFGTTMIVLDMIETGFLRESFFGKIFGEKKGDKEDEKEILRTMRGFNSDPTFSVPRKLGNGSFTAVEVQRKYLDAAKEFCGCFGASAEYHEVLGYWDMLLAYAEEDQPHEHLAEYVDWARKFCDVEGNMRKRGFDWSTAPATALWESKKEKGKPYTLFSHLKKLDYLFHELDPKGLARRHEEVGNLVRLVPQADIERYRALPKPNTRAYPRALNYRMAKRMIDSGKAWPVAVDWTFVKIEKKSSIIHLFESLDPFAIDPGIPPEMKKKYLFDIDL